MLPTLQIIYASTSGNVEVVSKRVAQSLTESRINSVLHRADTTKFETIIENSYFIFATSTWEHGIINPYFDSLLRDIENSSMKGKFAGFVGLGDTRYEPVLFCKGVEIIKDAFTKSGGKQIGTTLKVNGNPYPVLDSIVGDWTEQFKLQLRRFVH